MFGTPADMAVSEAYLKGVHDFDVKTAYDTMRRTALTGVPPDSRFSGRHGLQWYLSLGYCPDDKMGKSVAATLEYAWADHSLSLLASALGHAEDADLFARYAHSYRNVWNPQSRFFHPRDSKGIFFNDLQPDLITYLDFNQHHTRAYVEGSARQWRWAVPFDAERFVETTGPPEVFASELEQYFSGSTRRLGSWNPGPNYWHGNEPYFHAAYLFIDAGRPDLTQKWVRRVLDNKYADNYVGLDGNDDCGTLSAWYVFSALGLYPVAGTTRYWIGAPIFEEARLRLSPLHLLTILAENNPEKNPYVHRVWLNDQPLDRFWLDHAEIAEGGTLRFLMGSEPLLPQEDAFATNER
jgi:predicted alpha-1,2-mannosidase